jgi:hypothetical protein
MVAQFRYIFWGDGLTIRLADIAAGRRKFELRRPFEP